MSFNKLITPLMFSLLAMSSVAYAIGEQKYGVKVNYCGFDYDRVDFCTDKRMKAYSKVMNTRSPNFDKDKIIYIFEADKEYMNEPKPYIDKYYRMVVINPTDRTVTPASFGMTEARDYDGNLLTVNQNNESLGFDFNIDSNKFCFKGNWDQYRRGASYQQVPFCFFYKKYEGDDYKSFFFDELGYTNEIY